MISSSVLLAILASFSIVEASLSLPISSRISSVYITSPDVCLENLECRKGWYCGSIISNYSYTCRRQQDVGETCDRSNDYSCKESLVCQSVGTAQSRTGRCTRRPNIGDPCDPKLTFRCGNGSLCRAPKNRCRLPGTARDPCSREEHCMLNNGFYCESSTGQCKQKERPGGPCAVYLSRYKCDGYCEIKNNARGEGTCVAYLREGAACREDSQCANTIEPFVPTPRLLCNRPIGSGGFCLLETKLLRRLGQRCNPKKDACDARRGLSCRWTQGLRRFACQQRANGKDRHVTRYCTPGSALSACKPYLGKHQICRQASDSVSESGTYKRFFQCLPPVLTLPPGRVCNWHGDFVKCGAGYDCAYVPGIRTSSRFHPPPEPKFCVRLGTSGARCGSFSERCAPGLTCVSGRCVPGSDPPEVLGKFTHASFSVDCSTLPCVPGAVCVKNTETGERQCEKPTRIMQRGQPCYDTPLVVRKCASGLTCALNRNNLGLYLCRKADPTRES